MNFSRNIALLVSIIFMIFTPTCEGQVKDNSRAYTLFNVDWKFSKGEMGNESKYDFDDSLWRKLNLPHDWAIEGPFSKEHDTRTGGLPISGAAWYRKHFRIDEEQKDKIISIVFDGVMNNAEIFVNGNRVGERPFGYIGFEIDVTPYLRFGKDNVIAVRVNPKELSARWYPGAGIYRNVHFNIKSPISIAYNGTYVTTPKINKKEAEVVIKTTLENKTKTKTSGEYTLKTSIVDSSNNEVATTESKVDLTSNEAIEHHLLVKSPILWDVNNPYLYTAKTLVLQNGVQIDNYETTFGVRSINFSRESGFELNGRNVKFKGVCLHHDLGPLGAAVNYRATQRQLEIMKEIGVNAIRTSHNPPSPEQLELCDKMGLLVIVEAFDEWQKPKVENGYNKLWDRWHEKDLRDIIKRDRNHPSVIMWSLGNEIREQGNKHGGEVAADLAAICHDEDSSRPVTAGFNQLEGAIKNGLADAVDIVGFNYKPTQYDNVLSEHPDWLVYGAETSSCVSSRGVYHLPLENYEKHASLQVSSYDIISPPWAYPPDFETYAQETMRRSLGEFVWTGFDYLGEPTPYNGRDNETDGKWGGDWPSRSSYFGIVDLCGFPKDRFYYYQSVWTSEPMVHILPHWNWEGVEVNEIPVYCYTNCDEAELFLNGRSLGKKIMGVDKTSIPAEFNWWRQKEKTWDSPYRLSWNVNYEPGELKIVAYKDGAVAVEKSISTAGEAAKISLLPDRKIIKSDGYDLSFITVKIEDEDGSFCPLADNLVSFKVDGPATIVAVGNGDATSIESFQANYRKAFNGLCMLIIKSKKGESGKVKVTAQSEKLEASFVEIIVE